MVISSKWLKILWSLLLVLSWLAQETDFLIYPELTLEFPFNSEDMTYWNTKGSCILGKSQLFLNPEVKQRQGVVWNTRPLPEKQWIIDIEFMIGNSANSVFGTNGAAIFFLQEIMHKDIGKGTLFGYTNEFIGAGIFLNTGLRKRDPASGERVEGIQGMVSDGSNIANTWDIPTEDTWYYHFRTHGEPNTIRISYNTKQIEVLFFDKTKNEFMHCLNLDIDFSKTGGYLLMSSSSGVWDEDYHIIKSIKTMNPNKIDKTHHEEETKKRKGLKYLQTLKSSQDVLHQNRLTYANFNDLVNKVNKEIKIFYTQTETLNSLIRKEVTHTVYNDEGVPQSIDIDKINKDTKDVMRDLFILNRMMNYTFDKLDQIEQMTK